VLHRRGEYLAQTCLLALESRGELPVNKIERIAPRAYTIGPEIISFNLARGPFRSISAGVPMTVPSSVSPDSLIRNYIQAGSLSEAHFP